MSMALSHSTLCSVNADKDGYQYYVNFDLASPPVAHQGRRLPQGKRKKIYVGILCGRGPEAGNLCVVKVPRHSLGSRAWCRRELSKAQLAQQLAQAFSARIRDLKLGYVLEFTHPLAAIVDSTAIFTFLRRRKLGEGEWTVVEEVLQGEFVEFVDRDGVPHPYHPAVSRLLEAFLHFSYHHSAMSVSGPLVVCGLAGVSRDSRLKLTTPSVHSRGKRFGWGDGGEEAMIRVFRNHVCSDLCSDLDLPSMESLKDWQKGSLDLVIEPSAPFEDFEPYHDLD